MHVSPNAEVSSLIETSSYFTVVYSLILFTKFKASSSLDGLTYQEDLQDHCFHGFVTEEYTEPSYYEGSIAMFTLFKMLSKVD